MYYSSPSAISKQRYQEQQPNEQFCSATSPLFHICQKRGRKVFLASSISFVTVIAWQGKTSFLQQAKAALFSAALCLIFLFRNFQQYIIRNLQREGKKKERRAHFPYSFSALSPPNLGRKLRKNSPFGLCSKRFNLCGLLSVSWRID